MDAAGNLFSIADLLVTTVFFASPKEPPRLPSSRGETALDTPGDGSFAFRAKLRLDSPQQCPLRWMPRAISYIADYGI